MTTKAEAEYLNRLHRLGCIVCRKQGYMTDPEIHHPRHLAGMGQKASHFDAIPLCPIHHRTGGYRMAIHAGRKAWEERFGTEAELLAQVKGLMGIKQEGGSDAIQG